jgi:hypothetical protein
VDLDLRADLDGWSVAALVGLAGLVVTVVQLVRRKLAWPFAVGTLVLCG